MDTILPLILCLTTEMKMTTVRQMARIVLAMLAMTGYPSRCFPCSIPACDGSQRPCIAPSTNTLGQREQLCLCCAFLCHPFFFLRADYPTEPARTPHPHRWRGFPLSHRERRPGGNVATLTSDGAVSPSPIGRGGQGEMLQR